MSGKSGKPGKAPEALSTEEQVAAVHKALQKKIAAVRHYLHSQAQLVTCMLLLQAAPSSR
jgi:hypothetical protein